MSAPLKSLRLAVLATSALGLLSITLTGEISTAWCAAGWAAWALSVALDRLSGFQAALKRMETLAVAAMISMLFFDFFSLHNSIFIAVTHFLLLFQIVKLAGQKERKDCLQIFVFSFFQVLAACTLSVDPWHAAVLLALIPTGAAALFWNQIARESEQSKTELSTSDIRNYRRLSAIIEASALPVNVVLTIAVFILVPRLTLNAPLPGFSGNRMGYIDQVNLAQKGNLSEDASVVLWMAFPKPADYRSWDGHLRGDVLSVFDGHSWMPEERNASRIFTPDSNGVFSIGTLRSSSSMRRQVITLSDTSAGTLFAIGHPVRVAAPVASLQEHEGGALHWLSPWRRPMHYEVLSTLGSEDAARPIHLKLPNVPLSRVRALAAKAAGRGTALEQAQNIEHYLQVHYRYSTNFGDRVPDNPVDAFLFIRREGTCAHFASAMALMLRLQNIPSRLVAGYFKGEWNAPAQAVIIRERDAHAWVEAYLPGRGWTDFDPSPRFAAGETGGAATVFSRLRQYSDYFAFLWERFVIQYDLYAQIRAFENVRNGSGHLGAKLSSFWSAIQFRLRLAHGLQSGRAGQTGGKENPLPWKETLAFITLSAASFLIYSKRRARAGYATAVRFYHRFLEQMARAGHPKEGWETGQEFAVRLAGQAPKDAAMAREITRAYYDARFREGHR